MTRPRRAPPVRASAIAGTTVSSLGQYACAVRARDGAIAGTPATSLGHACTGCVRTCKRIASSPGGRAHPRGVLLDLSHDHLRKVAQHVELLGVQLARLAVDHAQAA